MGKERPYKKYDFIRGGRIVHSGITKNLDRREGELQQKWPSGYIEQVGGSVTED